MTQHVHHANSESDLLSHLNLTPTMRRLAASNVECMTPKERLFIKAAGERVDFETVDAPNPDNTTHAEKTANADQRTMRLLVNAIEIARMNPLKLTKSEAMNAGKVSEISQARLAGIALERWDEPGSGAGIVREARVSLQQVHFLFWVLVACNSVALADSTILYVV